MKRNILNFLIAFFLAIYCQSALAAGIDETINQIIAPISSCVVSIVFFSLEIYEGTNVPLIVVWLIVASLFCTIYLRN